MIMTGQSRRLSQPLRWGRRERSVVAVLLGCAVLAAGALLAFALTGGSREPANCINVTFASTLGGAEIHACGARARRICASGALRGIADLLEPQCRRAGYPFVAPAPQH